jgi:hypothetical protein
VEPLVAAELADLEERNHPAEAVVLAAEEQNRLAAVALGAVLAADPEEQIHLAVVAEQDAVQADLVAHNLAVVAEQAAELEEQNHLVADPLLLKAIEPSALY